MYRIRIKRASIILLAGLMPTLTTLSIKAAEYQSLESIQIAAKEFITQQYQMNNDSQVIEVVPGRLDPRLRLVKCEQPLDANTPSNLGNRGRLTVNIKCNGTKPWSVYVPVQTKIMQNIVVLSNSLPRNARLNLSDLHIELRDINKLHSGYFTKIDEVAGKTLRRSLSSGLTLSPAYISSPKLIKRGQQVTLLAKTGGIMVTMVGKAMSDGAAGERIKVKNINSNRVVEGTITNTGSVETHVN